MICEKSTTKRLLSFLAQLLNGISRNTRKGHKCRFCLQPDENYKHCVWGNRAKRDATFLLQLSNSIAYNPFAFLCF
jgi:hypothetical protein